MSDTPFDVVDEVEIGDLSTVKEDQQLLPPTNNALLSIKQASNRVSQDGGLRKISLQLKLVEGIGEDRKYAGKVLFADVTYWADTTKYTAEKYTGKNRAYLNELKLLLSALGYDIATPPKINDEFFGSITGRTLRANITVRDKRALDKSTGTWEATGEQQNVVSKFKPAE